MASRDGEGTSMVGRQRLLSAANTGSVLAAMGIDIATGDGDSGTISRLTAADAGTVLLAARLSQCRH